MTMRSETGTRWIVLGTDGRHVSLGRTEPSEAEIATASDALAAQGLSGWLARMQGEYYSRRKVTLEPLQRIGIAHNADWQAALAAFHAARRRATQ
jgi:DNA-binding transcriptional MocR family regulator